MDSEILSIEHKEKALLLLLSGIRREQSDGDYKSINYEGGIEDVRNGHRKCKLNEIKVYHAESESQIESIKCQIRYLGDPTDKLSRSSNGIDKWAKTKGTWQRRLRWKIQLGKCSGTLMINNCKMWAEFPSPRYSEWKGSDQNWGTGILLIFWITKFYNISLILRYQDVCWHVMIKQV